MRAHSRAINRAVTSEVEGPGDFDGWWRPAEGFELRDDLEAELVRSECWLVPPAARPGQRFAEWIQPQLSPSRMEDFAGLDSDQEILAFANRYGWLRGKPTRLRTPDGRWLAAEPLSLWREHSGLVRRVLDLVTSARQVERSKAEPDRRALRDKLGAAPSTTDSQLVGMALGEAALMVESRLPELVAFRITPQRAGATGVISYVPNCPLGAVYLHLARHLTGRLGHWRNCRHCGKSFLASRSDAQFHSATCRSNARYERRRMPSR